MYRHRAAALIALGILAGPALAQSPGRMPPQDALPLPEVLQQVQQRENVASFDEVSWDDDGYWEIEFFGTTGAKKEIHVDPLTGATLAR
jgi:hypothetical protein